MTLKPRLHGLRLATRLCTNTNTHVSKEDAFHSEEQRLTCKVSKDAKIKNSYNQASNLTQDTNGILNVLQIVSLRLLSH